MKQRGGCSLEINWTSNIPASVRAEDWWRSGLLWFKQNWLEASLTSTGSSLSVPKNLQRLKWSCSRRFKWRSRGQRLKNRRGFITVPHVNVTGFILMTRFKGRRRGRSSRLPANCLSGESSAPPPPTPRFYAQVATCQNARGVCALISLSLKRSSVILHHDSCSVISPS